MPPRKKKPKEPAKRAPILIIEDTGMVRQTLIRILKLGQFECIEAAGAEEAVRQVAAHDVSMIICDINMPGVDGITLIGKLKQTEKIRHVPVIMCSAMHEKQFIVNALKAGAVDYIVKPFEPQTVLQKVIKAMEREPGTKLIAKKPAPEADAE